MMTRTTALTCALAALAASRAPAQHPGVKPALGLEDARRVVTAAAAEARRHGSGGAIAVVDDGGHVLCVERLDGTFPAAAGVAIGKARTAAMFRKPTGVFEDLINRGRTTMVALPDFTPLRGGVPIEIGGQVVGAVGVSGAASAEQDEEIASAAVSSLRAGGRPADASYFDRKAVDAAFARGAPLVEVPAYKVHASRRDAPGQAEVHEHETDIIYVLEGSATFVTGGSVVDGVQTAAGEIRGRSIAGGVSRRLSKGDVIIVPAGTPHWFKEIEGPVTYYVVKVL